MDENEIKYGLKNNYMFLTVMNRNEESLKNLVCALLKIEISAVKKLEITNPIVVGEGVDDKLFILDLALIMNDNTIINIELQVVNDGNWPERSLGYLCRSFDNLNHGDDYIDVKPAIHISILDFTPFKNHKGFYSTFKMMNTNDHYNYTEKFVLHVLDISKLKYATDDDKKYKLDVWAKMFQSKTRGELMAIASENAEFKSTVDTIVTANYESGVRYWCEARERSINRENAYKRKIDEKDAEIERLKKLLEEKQ